MLIFVVPPIFIRFFIFSNLFLVFNGYYPLLPIFLLYSIFFILYSITVFSKEDLPSEFSVYFS